MADYRSNNCAICSGALHQMSVQKGSTYYYNCSNCGPYGVSNQLLEDGLLNEKGKIIACFLLQHPTSTLERNGENTPLILSRDILKFEDSYVAPNALELLDNFLSYYCTVGKIGEEFRGVKKLNLSIAAKTLELDAGAWVVKQADKMGWLDSFRAREASGGYYDVTFEISAIGWQAFYERQKSDALSQQAFLALQFSNETLRNIIVPEIKLACTRAGFNLLAVNENRKAGLIDNKIRVDIRNSRFLVVDLSDQNQGAYFEAGFAEGLGKPIFYICDKEVFDKHHRTEKREKTVHFDVEHHDIIVWDKDNPKDVGEQLLASIRNTLPNEAKMSDS